MQQDRPTVDRQADDARARSTGLGTCRITRTFAIRVRASIGGVVQDRGHQAACRAIPDDRVWCRPAQWPRRQRQVVSAKETYHCIRGTRRGEGGEDQPQTCVHFIVGINDDLATRHTHQTHWQWLSQVAA